MNRTSKISKAICEICYKSDEFYLCGVCFGKYLEKSYNFRNSTNLEKFSLKTLIQEILTKNYQNLLMHNQKLFKLNAIERLKKNLKTLDTALIYKQNIINSISAEIKKRKENLKKFKEILERERIKLNSCVAQNYKNSEDKLKEAESVWKEKIIKLAKSIMNKSLINLIDVNEYFMIQEFVKPDLIENRKNPNKENNFKEFDKIQNVLSISDSVCLFNIKDNKEYDIKYEKFIKFRQSILKNRGSIFKLNIFIFSLLSGIKLLSSNLDIYLPYEIYSTEDFLILNPTIEKIYNLYMPVETISNTNLNEVLQGYTYLDINLKFLTNFLNTNENMRVSKTKERSKSFQNLHTIFTPDLKEFLNVEFFIEKNVLNINLPMDTNFIYSKSNYIGIEFDKVEEQKIEGDLCEIENEIEIEVLVNAYGADLDVICEKYKSEVKGYVLLENYFY